jgi:heme exporter protein D
LSAISGYHRYFWQALEFFTKRMFTCLQSVLISHSQILTKKYRRRARNAKLRNKLEWFLVIQYHALVSIATGIIIIGLMRVYNLQDNLPTSVYLQVGMGVLLLCWVLIFGWAFFSLPIPEFRDLAVFTEGTKVSPLLTLYLIKTNRAIAVAIRSHPIPSIRGDPLGLLSLLNLPQ